MKRLFVLIACAVSWPAFAQIQGMQDKDHMKGMDAKAEKKEAKGASHKASGTVTKVDEKRNKVTVKHGPVESLKWPAMTMAFTVKDPQILHHLQKDQKIDFEFVEQGKDYVITSVK